jgi:pimeloyl-ACP methyl ester carboxylesterase
MTWFLIAAGLAVLYQIVVVLALKVGWRNPRVPHRRDPSAVGLAFDTIRIPTAGGKTLHGWWIASGKAGAPCLVLVHGWGRNVERMIPWIEMLHPAGYDLLAFDARHHGSSDADEHASMLKFSEDIRAAVDYAVRRGGGGGGGGARTTAGVGVLGLSVGGSAAIHAASLDPRIAAVATVGAFADPSDPRATIGKHWWVLSPGLPLAFKLVERRIGFRFRDVAPELVIGNARARFLLIHGEDDAVVPVSHGQRLAAARPDARTWIVAGRGHSDPHREPEMAAKLTAFFAESLAAPSPPAASA